MSVNQFKKRFVVILKFFLVILSFTTLFNFSGTSLIYATVNKQINYQGKLTNSSNVTVADGLYNIEFKLYTVASGGAAVWTETDTGSNKIQVTSGLFSVMLGSTTAFTGVDFNQTLYLGVNIGGTGSPSYDGEMTPRKIIGSVPSALVADTLQNLTPSQFIRSDAANSTSTASTYLSITNSGSGDIANFIGAGAVNTLILKSNGNVGLSTTSPFATLSVNAAAGATSFAIGSSTATNFIVDKNGNVGVGTANPSGQFTVENSTYTSNLALINDGVTGTPPAYPGGVKPAFSVVSNQTAGSAPLFLGYNNGGAWNADFLVAACGSFSKMCVSLGVNGFATALEYNAGNLQIGGGDNGNFSTVNFLNSGPTIFGSTGITTFAGNVGIGTTSPYSMLSVAGQVVAQNFVATSTSISTFPYASTTALTVSAANGLALGSLTGPLQAINGLVSASSTIAALFGGTGISNPTAAGILLGNYSGTGWQQIATSSLGLLTTTVAEGSNLYYTTGRAQTDARTALSTTATGLTYTSGTGVFSLTAGYNIPLTASTTNWNTFYNAPSTQITAGTNLAWAGNTLNVTGITTSQWTTTGSDIYYNTGKVGVGTTSPFATLSVNNIAGTPGFVVGSSTATNFIVDKNGNVGVGTANPGFKLDVNGVASVGTLNLTTPNAGITFPFSNTIVTTSIDGVTAFGGNYKFNSNFQALSMSGFIANDTGISGGNVSILGGAGLSTNFFGTDFPASGGSVIIRAGLSTGSGTNTSGNIQLQSSDSVTRFVISTTGNVGIGTTSPFAMLSVAGSGFFNGNLTASNITATGTLSVAGITSFTGAGTTTFAGPIGSASGNFIIGSAGTTNNILLNPYGGKIGIGTTTPYATLSVNNVAGTPGFVVGSSTATSFIVDQNGRVGIGTTSPMSAFSVVGDVSVLNASGGSVVGYSNTATAGSSVAFGTLNSVSTVNDVAMGRLNTVSNSSTSSGIGLGNLVINSNSSSAYGTSNTVQNNGNGGNFAFGVGNTIQNNTTIGTDFAFGGNNLVTGATSTAFGAYNTLSGLETIAFGLKNTVSGSGASAFGSYLTNAIATSTVIGPNDASKLTILNGGSVGIGTSSPYATLSVNNIAGTPGFVVGSSTATSFIVDQNGKVGIATSSPFAQLSMELPSIGGATTNGIYQHISTANQNINYLYNKLDSNNNDVGVYTGLTNDFTRSISSQSNTIIGVNNTLTTGSNDTLYGIKNTIVVNSGVSPSTAYGLYNDINLSNDSVSNTGYGTYSTLKTFAGDVAYGNFVTSNAGSTAGTQYGTYVDLTSGSASTKYPGIFLGGSVGIGTTTPTGTAYIYQAGSGVNGLTIRNSNNNDHAFEVRFANDGAASAFITGSGAATFANGINPGVGGIYFSTAGNTTYEINGTNGTPNQYNNFFGHQFNVGANGSTTVMTISQGGSVGIGTTSPGSILSVAGSAGGTSPLFMISTSTSAFATSTVFTIDKNGNIGIGSSSPTVALSLATGTTAANGINFGDATANLYRSTASTLRTDGSLVVGNILTVGNQLNMNGSGITSASSIGFNSNFSGDASGDDVVVNNAKGLVANAGSTVTFEGYKFTGAINQTGGATGISRGLLLSPTLTAAYDFRALETAAYTFNLNQSTTTLQSILQNAFTVASTTASTLTNAYQEVISGAPVAGTNVTISTSTALAILGGAVNGGGSVTNAYGLQVFAPTGATNNYAASFMNGNVGIGTSTPAAILSVYGTAGAAAFNVGSSSTSFIVDKFGNVGIGTSVPTYKVHILAPGQASTGIPVDVLAVEINGLTSGTFAGYGPSVLFKDSSSHANFMARIAGVYEPSGISYNAGLSFYTNPATGSTDTMVERLRISSAGNVGIGTTSPLARLDVAGANNGTAALLQVSSVASFATTTKFLIDSGGNVGIGTTSPFATFSVNAAAGATSFVIGSSTATTFIVDQFGNVGIGTTSPYSTLSVAGQIASQNFVATSLTATSTIAGSLAIGAASYAPAGSNSLAVSGTVSALNLVSVSSTGSGSIAFGNVSGSSGSLGRILSSGTGSLAGGSALFGPDAGSSITASGQGSVALGYMRDGYNIVSSGFGSFAFGYGSAISGTGGSITSSGLGSVAMGGGLTASNTFSMAFGTGFTNSTANTFKVGYSSIPTLTVSATSLGIGTTSPLARLDVAGANNGTAALLQVSSVASFATTTKFLIDSGGNVGIGTTSPFATLSVNNSAGIAGFVVGSSTATSFIVDQNGRIGIGTTSPASTLTVTGSACISSGVGATAACSTTAGTITANAFNTAAADLAERYKITDKTIEAGDVVALDTTSAATVKKADKNNTQVLGIISTEPGFLLGSTNLDDATSRPVALSGRVPVKFSTENGSVKIGDSITLSLTKPGYAMKVGTTSAAVIGTALENQTSNGMLTVFVRSSLTSGLALGDVAGELTKTDTSLVSEFAAFMAGTSQWGSSQVSAVTGFFKNIFADKVTTKTLCLDDVCITKDQLKTLLSNANVTASSTPSSTPSQTQTSTPTSSGSSSTSTTTPSTAPTTPTIPTSTTTPATSPVATASSTPVTPVVTLPPPPKPETPLAQPPTATSTTQ